jgi:hypothetical protein
MAAASELVDGVVPETPPPGFPSGLRVLVVDDDPLCLLIVGKMLRRCNYLGARAPRAGPPG